MRWPILMLVASCLVTSACAAVTEGDGNEAEDGGGSDAGSHGTNSSTLSDGSDGGGATGETEGGTGATTSGGDTTGGGATGDDGTTGGSATTITDGSSSDGSSSSDAGSSSVGSSSSSSSLMTTTDVTTTGGDPADLYPPCQNGSCPANSQCEIDGSGNVQGDFCGRACDDASDCPDPAVGEAFANCGDINGDGIVQQYCYLDCDQDNLECPPGMDCGTLRFHTSLGSPTYENRRVCVWP